jgi:hypothetical protein
MYVDLTAQDRARGPGSFCCRHLSDPFVPERHPLLSTRQSATCTALVASLVRRVQADDVHGVAVVWWEAGEQAWSVGVGFMALELDEPDAAAAQPIQ